MTKPTKAQLEKKSLKQESRISELEEENRILMKYMGLVVKFTAKFLELKDLEMELSSVLEPIQNIMEK